MPAHIHYHVLPASPEAHVFQVTLTVDKPDPAGQAFSLPVWIPGSYLIREFARHIGAVRASDSQGEVALSKLDKQRWQAAPATGPLTLIYSVYAFDLSVRGAYLDQQRGFFNGTSLFLAVEGQQAAPVDVQIDPPEGKDYRDWQVATSLPTLAAKPYGFGSYQAANYDELIDHPVEMGEFTLLQFKACGVPHDFVLAGRLPKLDGKRLTRDVKAICEQQIKMFGEPAPFDRYVFMTVVLGEGYGGLEHRASTALVCTRDSLPLPGETSIKSSYRQYLGLISHEYFHTWNVKRIKPAAYAPYDLTRENYSRLLWAFEGLTSYYDDICLLRSGVIDLDSYLELLSHTITGVLRTPGRLQQTLADSSFDTWIKYYRQDENSPNSGVSYYTKGALAGLCLDLHIRRATGGSKSLDDVMLALWQRYGRDFYTGAGQGVPEEGWEQVAEEVTGLPLQPLFDRWLRSTEELPLPELLAEFGVAWQNRSSAGASDKGGWLEKPRGPATWLGARTSTEAGLTRLTHVFTDGPAQKAGLSAGDVLVAIDDLKASPANVEAALALGKAGDKLAIVAFRRDEVLRCKLKLQEAPTDTVGLKRDDSDPQKLAARQGWLGS